MRARRLTPQLAPSRPRLVTFGLPSGRAQCQSRAWFDALKGAAGDIGGIQTQNAGTIAGNLCNASPAADGVPALLALDASVELLSVSGTQTLPLGEFILGNRKTRRRPDQLLAAIL